MNIFSAHESIVSQYQEYINSFLNIGDGRIKETIEQELIGERILPKPLVQFNPSFELGGSIRSLVDQGVLRPEVAQCFPGFQLFTHQVEALKRGSEHKSFVVTSGTGSGKSLTYLASIFNKLFAEEGEQEGVKAIIVYPMNALINSQFAAMKEFAENYEKESGKAFPISFEKYTGQESEQDKSRVRENPPQILLTNYMMLEYLLTRPLERNLTEAIYRNLDFLVFDELHTYRGRQGADVAMLIRRIKAQCVNDEILCIGTSATMASGGETSLLDQKTEVAKVATKIFGQSIAPENVITEKLRLSFEGPEIDDTHLQKAIEQLDVAGDEGQLKENEVARWLERNICLEKREGEWFRARPKTIEEIINTLSQKSGLNKEICEKKLIALLNWADQINGAIANERPRRSYLPYKLHQFIAQTGSVFVTLDKPEERLITLEAKNKTSKSDGQAPYYQVVFSRYSGYEYICLAKNDASKKLEPTAFNTGRLALDDESDESHGYLLIEKDDALWNPEEDEDYLPDSWFNVTKGGQRNIKGEHRHKLPTQIYFNRKGDFSETKKEGYQKGWFMAAPLPFDPSSQTTFEGGNPREHNKLSRLGIEGRSTATTILSYLTIKELIGQGLNPAYQKLLCFTDVRQDAALQSGHFNDFIKVGVLRSAIYKAVQRYGALNYENIAQKVFEQLALSQEDFAQQPSETGSFQYDENEKALKRYLSYRILHDLRRGWRVVLPNLEQTGLLHIGYQRIDEELERDKWDKLTGFRELSRDLQKELLCQTLDFFRTSFAFHFSLYDHVETDAHLIANNLKAPWNLDQNEKLKVPNYLRLEKPASKRQRIHTMSIGSQSAFGKYVKRQLKSVGVEIKGKELKTWMEELLDLLSTSGYLRKEQALGAHEPSLYRLNGVNMVWRPGDKEIPHIDKVRVRSGKEILPKVNTFFQKFYDQDFRAHKTLKAAEHTGQLGNDERVKHENEFIAGDISALYCSPTMELGVDISELNIVQMRNVPPNPANYAQRSGRAGRSGQAALVLTYCANTSPHDRHYFENRIDMVAGIVAPPKLDLGQEELVQAHLHALYVSQTDIEELNVSIGELLDLYTNKDGLPLLAEVREKLNLNEGQRDTLIKIFDSVLKDLLEQPEEVSMPWYMPGWTERKLKSAPAAFDAALARWRELYQRCVEQLQNSALVAADPRKPAKHPDKEQAKNEGRYAQRQLDLLMMRTQYSSSNSMSEFYPYRYLAAEGFLPGYNFTRLPVRLFVPRDTGGEYIARPRFVALKEFGPQNVIYHSGGKYRVNQMLWSETDNPLVKAKMAKSSGYLLMGSDYTRNTCPITGADLSLHSSGEVIADMLEIRESRSESQERITCEEEERQIMGYDISTAFYLQNHSRPLEQFSIKVDGEVILNIKYLPAARIVQINNQWKVKKEKEGSGYYIGKKTGFWKKPSAMENPKPDAEPVERVRLYAENTADALYIEPTKNLNFEEPFQDGVITFAYALQRAFESLFQVESNELNAALMGTADEPNILMFEASEGSLGIMAAFIKDVRYFKQAIDKAYEICHFHLPEEEQERYGSASYADLLSFYNQRYHKQIDRFKIKNVLEGLRTSTVELTRSELYGDYEDHYQQLLAAMDKRSATEEKFLSYLHKNKLRLPDKAQVDLSPHGCFTIPDFVYQEHVKVMVYCDGTPHDDPKQQAKDEEKRQCVEALGFEVLVWHYLTPIADFVASRPDVFKKAVDE